MVSIKQQSGAVLIIVLLFSTLFSMVALLSMEMTWLEAKMTQSFVLGIQQRIKSEQAMIALEASFYADPESFIQSGQAQFIQFVPDSIRFGERSGQAFYLLYTDEIITTHAVRQDIKQNENGPVTFLNGVSATIEFETYHGETHLVLRDIESNVIQASFLAPHLSGEFVLLATDRFSKGWVDAIYIGNMQGEIWQLDTTPLNYESWVWRKWSDVGMPIQKLYATHYQSESEPILLVQTKDDLNNESKLQGIVCSETVWSVQLKDAQRIKLQANWIQVDAMTIDVSTGQIKPFKMLERDAVRRSWR